MNHPQIAQGLLQGPPYPDPPLPGFIAGADIDTRGIADSRRRRGYGSSRLATWAPFRSEPPAASSPTAISPWYSCNARPCPIARLSIRIFTSGGWMNRPILPVRAVTDLVDPLGYSVPPTGVVQGPVYHLVVTFDEEVFAGDPALLRDSVLNPENFVLYRGMWRFRAVWSRWNSA